MTAVQLAPLTDLVLDDPQTELETLSLLSVPALELVVQESSVARARRLEAERPAPYLRVLPSTEPPYDDERPEHERTWPRTAWCGWEQLTLIDRTELTQPVLVPPVFAVDEEPELVAAPQGDVFDQEVEPEPSPDGLAPAGETSQRYVRAFLEVLSGQRQLRTLAKVLAPDVMDELDGRGADLDVVWAATLQSVRICEPVPGVAEISAVVIGPQRTQALTMRICGFDGVWVVTQAAVIG